MEQPTGFEPATSVCGRVVACPERVAHRQKTFVAGIASSALWSIMLALRETLTPRLPDRVRYAICVRHYSTEPTKHTSAGWG